MQPLDLSTCPLTGSNLIEASAGTGKTYTITGLYLRLILEQGLTVDRILVVTFTEAATLELRGRLLSRLQAALRTFTTGRGDDPFLARLREQHLADPLAVSRLEDAVRMFDQAAVFTIHGFCLRMLHDHAFENGGLFDTELVGSQEAITREIAEDFWRRLTVTSSDLFVRYLLNRGVGPESLLRSVSGYLAHPHLTIIPAIGAPDTGAVEKWFRVAAESVGTAWYDGRGEIVAILANHKGINRSRYRQASMPLLVEAMDRFAKSAGDEPDLFKSFEKFTAAEIAAAMKPGYSPPEHPFFDLCAELRSRHHELEGAFADRFKAMKIALLHYLRQELESRKAQQNVRSFDDLLLDLHEVVQRGGSHTASLIRERYPAALIDEFQDTDPLQYEIFRTVFGSGSTLFLIGDPKQAIYGFRGADIFAYLAAVDMVERRYTLHENWRSEPRLIQAVNTVFGRAAAPFVFEEIEFQPSIPPAAKPGNSPLLIDGHAEAPLSMWVVGTGETDAGGPPTKAEATQRIIDAVANEIVRLLQLADDGRLTRGGRAIAAADIAVLVRKNREAQLMKAALLRAGVPAVVFSTGSVFDTIDCEELIMVLRGVLHPENESALKAAASTTMIGWSANDINALSDDDVRREELNGRFRTYNELWRRRGFFQMFSRLMRTEKVLSRLVSLPEGERRATNVRHLGELLHQESLSLAGGMERLMAWLVLQHQSPRQPSDDALLRLESDEQAVRLITIHKSKGLEFPIVFCPFTWEGTAVKETEGCTFHDIRDKTGLVLDFGSAQWDRSCSQALREQAAENVRLLYVALTRACSRCYWVWGLLKGAEDSAPAHVLHGPQSGRVGDSEADETAVSPPVTIQRLEDDLKQLTAAAPTAIATAPMPAGPAQRYRPPRREHPPLTCRRRAGAVDRRWRIASFSSLVSARPFAAEMADRDNLMPPPDRGADDPQPGKRGTTRDIFGFPAGAEAGTCLHRMMEVIDFTAVDTPKTETKIGEILRQYGYDTAWYPIIRRMIMDVLSAPLGNGAAGCRLNMIASADRINEMAFYFPLAALRPSAIAKTFRSAASGKYPEAFFPKLERLDRHEIDGFMKGYIDLVFRFGGRFYIVDWKSNFLGSHFADYQPERLAAVMAAEGYILQYHIYAIALHRYLASRIPKYTYTDHFGGVFYMFMRGVDPKAEDMRGIYYDRPEECELEKLIQAMGMADVKMCLEKHV